MGTAIAGHSIRWIATCWTQPADDPANAGDGAGPDQEELTCPKYWGYRPAENAVELGWTRSPSSDEVVVGGVARERIPPYPPYIRTDAQRQRWDLAEALAVLIFEDPPCSGSSWLATRVIYDMDLPTGDAGECEPLQMRHGSDPGADPEGTNTRRHPC
jgi:hypothetical protein